MSKQSLAEILADQLDQIDELGGPERHQLVQVIGRDAYESLIAKPKGADVVTRWLGASGKAKGPATRALALQIARVADKPELVKRIESEIADSFDIPDRPDKSARPISLSSSKPSRPRQVQSPKTDEPGKVDLAQLAKRDDLTAYLKQRQGEKR